MNMTLQEAIDIEASFVGMFEERILHANKMIGGMEDVYGTWEFLRGHFTTQREAALLAMRALSYVRALPKRAQSKAGFGD